MPHWRPIVSSVVSSVVSSAGGLSAGCLAMGCLAAGCLAAGCLATGSGAGEGGARAPRGRWTVVTGSSPARQAPDPRETGGGLGQPPGSPRARQGGSLPADPRSVPLPADPLNGLGTWYGRPFHGKRNASGEVYNMHGMTAAHRTLPFGTVVAVRNLRNGREVEVRITDRGPFGHGRIIDLSFGAAKRLGMVKAGVVPVRLRVVRWGKNCRTFHGRTTCSPSRHFPRPSPRAP